MYAVLIEADVTGVDREAGLAGLRDHIVPAITAMPGFRRHRRGPLVRLVQAERAVRVDVRH